MATSAIGLGRRNAFVTVAASQTGAALITAIALTKFRVVAIALSCGATPSTVQFNSGADAAAGTAISPVFNNSIVLTELKSGWFENIIGEGMTVSTGAGSNTGIIVVYERIS